MDKINWTAGSQRKAASVEFLGAPAAAKVRGFHQTFPQYKPTPLQNLNAMAAHCGLGGIFVKDESYRFGLNAFKALGATYAIGSYLAQLLGRDISEVSFEMLRSEEIKSRLGDITFTTATDGNHGRGVAWAAHQLGQKSVVYMPKGSAAVRLENIRAAGAEAYITELNYDDTVRLAAQKAREHGRIIVQDTSWEGYTEIPTWILQGYMTMVLESLEQMEAYGCGRPSHVFVQAGVGTFPAAVQGCLAAIFGPDAPKTIVVEPEKANCIFISALRGDGHPDKVTGPMDTMMAGLACGEPNPQAWEILRDYAAAFVSCPDYVSARGMRILGNPLSGDFRVTSGESAAVTTGLLSLIMELPYLSEFRAYLGLGPSSKVLLFSTEGDTDPDNYRRVVWDGLFPSLV